MLTFGSLFAGTGGIDLGLERAGMRCVWQVEIDEYCNKVLSKHWPDVPKFRDVRSVGAHNLAQVDLIAGGFPCQDISRAGKRAGLAGARSGLWGEFARIIGELRPRNILVENTPALLEPIRERGRIIAPAPISRVLGDLSALGYDAEWEVVSACAFGAAHTRERVFLVAYTHCKRCRELQPFTGIFRAPVADLVTKSRIRGSTSAGREDTGRVLWPPEPTMDRVADGIPSRLGQLRGLTNAVVPQVAEFIGRCILEAQITYTTR